MADNAAKPPAEQKISSFFEALRTLKAAEEDIATPSGKGDPILAARIKELRGYVDVFLKTEIPRKPRFVVTEHHVDPGAPVSVDVSFKDGVQFYDACQLSLSRPGMFVKTDALLAIDTVLDMTVKLEAEGVAFKVAGKVIWLNPRESQGRPQGMGLKLHKLGSVQRQLIADFMAGELPVDGLRHLEE
jgi:uncharacterized protein (TIGR02266 family)